MENDTTNDPWPKDENQKSTGNVILAFGSDFAAGVNTNNSKNVDTKARILNDAYSEKLEQKLERIKKQKCKSGKDMLDNFKSQKEAHMTNLMEFTGTTPYMNNGNVENPSFFENLYQTNSVYRRANPQQALESSEKLPIVHHDQLSIDNVEDHELHAAYVMK